MEENLPYEDIQPETPQEPQVQAETPQSLDEVEQLRLQVRELNQHLKDALLINQVFASCIEIMGETHLTKNEKYNIIRTLNEAITVEEVEIKTKAIKESMGIENLSEDFRKDQSEDDSYWSQGFKNELNRYFSIHLGLNIQDVFNNALVNIDDYFQLLTAYSNAQEDQEKVNQLTQQILDQEPKARAGLTEMKRIAMGLNSSE